MPFVMNLACVTMKMTMNESLVAATLNSAASMGKSDSQGSLEVGKKADFVVIDSNNWEHLIYQLVDPPIHSVYKNGKLIYSNSTKSKL
jgi:imidazolonepropionase